MSMNGKDPRICWPCRGPNRSRAYSSYQYRWRLSKLDANPDIVTKLMTTKKFGKLQWLSLSWSFVPPILGVIFAILGPFGWAAWAVAGVLGLMPVIAILLASREYDSIGHIPQEIIALEKDGSCLLFDRSIRIPAAAEKHFRATVLKPKLSTAGAGAPNGRKSYAELDLVVSDAGKESIYPLIAHSYASCCGHAKRLASAFEFRLKRVERNYE